MKQVKPILNPALLNSIKSTPNLPVGAWYLVTAVTLTVLNRPFEIPTVWSYALANSAIPGSETEAFVKQQYEAEAAGKTNDAAAPREDGKESALAIARRLREGLLKSAIIGGLPKASCHNTSIFLYPSSNKCLRQSTPFIASVYAHQATSNRELLIPRILLPAG